MTAFLMSVAFSWVGSILVPLCLFVAGGVAFAYRVPKLPTALVCAAISWACIGSVYQAGISHCQDVAAAEAVRLSAERQTAQKRVTDEFREIIRQNDIQMSELRATMQENEDAARNDPHADDACLSPSSVQRLNSIGATQPGAR